MKIEVHATTGSKEFWVSLLQPYLFNWFFCSKSSKHWIALDFVAFFVGNVVFFGRKSQLRSQDCTQTQKFFKKNAFNYTMLFTLKISSTFLSKPQTKKANELMTPFKKAQQENNFVAAFQSCPYFLWNTSCINEREDFCFNSSTHSKNVPIFFFPILQFEKKGNHLHRLFFEQL